MKSESHKEWERESEESEEKRKKICSTNSLC